MAIRRVKLKPASGIFHPVDPDLNVIDRGSRRKGRSTRKDWDRAGGAFCPSCNQEVVRLIPDTHVCTACDQELVQKQDREDKKRARQLKFINQHNARIDKKKKAA